MKKTLLYLAAICFVFSITLTSCNKEVNTLNFLHGTWKHTAQLDVDGFPVLTVAGITNEELVTFFLCDSKDQGDCAGTSKITTVNTLVSPAQTSINASRWSYSVYGKTQLVWSGTVYEIESINAKEFKIHDAEHPKATGTYEKQK